MSSERCQVCGILRPYCTCDNAKPSVTTTAAWKTKLDSGWGLALIVGGFFAMMVILGQACGVDDTTRRPSPPAMTSDTGSNYRACSDAYVTAGRPGDRYDYVTNCLLTRQAMDQAVEDNGG